MSPATIPTTPPIHSTHSTVGANGSRGSNGGRVPDEVIDNLDVRIAGQDEHEPIAALAARAGSPNPSGALMVGAINGRLLAAVSMSTGEVVNEPTSSGEAVAAVVRYRVARLGRRPATSTPR